MLTRVRKKRILQLVTVSILVAQLLLPVNVILSAYALAPPPGKMSVFHYDFDTANGFDKEVKMLGDDIGNTPVFVLRRGATGTMNITFTSIEENDTVRIPSIWYAGNAATNYRDWISESIDLPNGITVSIEPQNVTLTPGSKATVTMRISAARDTEIRSYNLSFSFYEKTENGIPGSGASDGTVLTIVEGTTPLTTTTTTSVTTSNVDRTVTTTSTQTSTSTSTTTLSTIFTSTTTTTLTERASELSTYAWAVVGAIAIAAVLALALLRRKS